MLSQPARANHAWIPTRSRASLDISHAWERVIVFDFSEAAIGED